MPMRLRLSPIAPVLLGVVCAQIALGIMTTLIPLLLLRNGASSRTVGLIASCYFVGFLAGALTADRVVARAGHIRAFAVFAAIAADAALFMPFFTAPWMWGVLRIAIGYAASGLFLVAESWLNDRSDATTRGRTFGAYLVASWGGAAAGPLVLNGVDGSALLFVVVGLAFSTALLPMALTEQANPAIGPRHFLWLHRLFAISPLGVTCCVASGLCNSAFYALMPVYLEQRGYGVGTVPLFLSIAALAGLAAQYPIGVVSDRLGRRPVTLASIGVAFLLALVLAKTSGTALWLAIAIGAAFAGATAPLYGLGAGQTNDHADRADLVGVSGGLLFAWSVGSSIGPTAAGVVMGIAGPGGLFGYLASILGLVGLVTLVRMLARADVPLGRRHAFVPSLSWPARLPELLPYRMSRQPGSRRAALRRWLCCRTGASRRRSARGLAGSADRRHSPTAMPFSRYSALRIAAQALTGNAGWQPAWRDSPPRPEYDVIIIGGGGHGLATAYYLAKEHGISNVAVLEKGPIGLGNTGRNTTIVRSNYLLPENHHFYEWSLKLWEGLEQDLNYNVMMSQRGVLNTVHSDSELHAAARRGNAMLLSGIDAELLDRDEVRAFCPLIDVDNARFPVFGGLLQRRGGTARHDAVAWGFARAADARGVDIIQHCEVTGIDVDGGRVTGVQTSRGPIRARKIGLAVAGNSSRLCQMAGVAVPIESHVLQAFVSEAIKPLIDTVVTFGAAHFYISQSDKGGLVFGGGLDGWNSYAQRGNLPIVDEVFSAGVALMPALGRLRGLRQWGGVMDMTFDGSPIIGKLPVEGLYMTGGWCYGGFKATPGSGWCHAWTIARDAPHPLNAAFTLVRFREGRLLDERGAGPFPWLQ